MSTSMIIQLFVHISLLLLDMFLLCIKHIYVNNIKVKLKENINLVNDWAV